MERVPRLGIIISSPRDIAACKTENTMDTIALDFLMGKPIVDDTSFASSFLVIVLGFCPNVFNCHIYFIHNVWNDIIVGLLHVSA